VTPIRNKRGIYSLFTADYALITVFYLLLALTGVFAFEHIGKVGNLILAFWF